jgi:3-hydroxyisobutyrate dehydrogenase-like beta-hydroxyacid dehydrogenase
MGGRIKMDRIGFIGLGEMGFPMANRLCDAGYVIHTATHSNKQSSLDKVNSLREKGAVIEQSFAEVMKAVDWVITILPADKEVEEVLLNEAFLNHVNEDTLILDMTSCKAETIEKIGKIYTEKGARVVDAPVSGGITGAEQGTLSIFASGNRSDVDELEKVFSILGGKTFYLGLLGKGKAIKSINQMMVAVNSLAFIEAYRAAHEQGLDLDLVYDVIKQSSGYSNVFDRKFFKLVNRHFDNGFKLSLMRKDLKIALDSAGDMPLPVSRLVYELLLMAKDDDDLDYIAVTKLLE